MADSNSQPPLCPCGFWGSPQTQGLCSKCFKEHQNKVSEAEKSTPMSVDTSSSVGAISEDTLSKAMEAVQQSSTTSGTSSQTPEQQEKKQPQDAGACSAETAQASSEETPMDETDKSNGEKKDDEKPKCDTDEDAGKAEEKEPSPGVKRDIDDVIDPERPAQKNKKRCYKCNVKLELALREIGRCRCDYIFCPLHRLPEQHDCIYDHKEKGRQAAREKMVSPKKHVGTSLKRIDSDS